MPREIRATCDASDGPQLPTFEEMRARIVNELIPDGIVSAGGPIPPRFHGRKVFGVKESHG